MTILLANPRGFCAGVDRAIAIVERVLARYSAPIYVRHEVVHNRYVVEDLRRRGAIFIEELAQVPDGATLIFSAHGVPQTVRREAEQRGLRVFDATCPLVTKVHLEVMRHCRAGVSVILIGHRGHPEVEGTLGQYDSATGGIYLVENVADVATLTLPATVALAYVTQTTLSLDDSVAIIAALRERFPAIQAQRKATSATPRKIAKMRCGRWRSAASCCWSSVRPTVPIPIGCGSWQSDKAALRISLMVQMICAASGLLPRHELASLLARRHRRFW